MIAAHSVWSAPAVASDFPRLYTNEAFVEDATRTAALAIHDAKEVFAFVFSSLPERVTVYPTENYYYFSFYHDGTRFAGNIFLAEMDRDKGKLHFAYFEDSVEWNYEADFKHVAFDNSYGVTVEKLDRLIYRVSYSGKSVLFALNDLSMVRPPARAIGVDEKYLGPIFDESGIRFFLVYNHKLKIFHYILDETVKVADALFPAANTDRILIGKRTGFAFYRDHRLDRKILIGVFEGNVLVNNYFDGPFDQLPDNFIEGEALREAILEIEPRLAGQIDRLGRFPDGATRYLIGPYLQYRSEKELDVFHKCAMRKISTDQYYKCFDVEAQQKATIEPRSPAPANKKSKKAPRTSRADRAAKPH
jgi:hypothetical protein